MAVCTPPNASSSANGHLICPSTRSTVLGPSFLSAPSKQRTILICSAASRNDSLPLKKHQQKEDLLAELEDEIRPVLELQRESALKVRTMRHYECMYLVHEKHVDQLEEIIKKYRDFVREKKGRVWRLNNWGLRRLAYKIKGTWRANYILMNLEIGAEYINEFNNLLEKDERVIRHMIMTRKKAITEPCPPPEELPPTRKELLEAELSEEDEEDADEEAEADDEDGEADEDETDEDDGNAELSLEFEDEDEDEEEDDEESSKDRKRASSLHAKR